MYVRLETKKLGGRVDETGRRKERRKMQRGKQQLEGWKCVLLGVHWHSRGVLHTSRALTSAGRQMQQWNLRLLFH